jgi:hypothetical protein
VTLLAACSGGAPVEYTHSAPDFKLQVPGDLQPGPDKASEDGTASVSIRSDDRSREVFLIWSKTGSPTDAVAGFERHRTHPDLTRIVTEGDLPGGKGRYIQIERGGRTFVHSALASGGWAIECTASTAEPEPPAAYLDACKTLTGS